MCRLSVLLSDETRGIIDFICLPFAHNRPPMREICTFFFLARSPVSIEKYNDAEIFNYYIDFAIFVRMSRTVAKKIINVVHASIKREFDVKKNLKNLFLNSGYKD